MSLDFEDLAKVAQRCVADCPLIVLGSGAGVPHGLPSMPVLAGELLARVVPAETTTEREQWKQLSERLAETHDLEEALHAVVLCDSLLAKVLRGNLGEPLRL